MGKLQEDMAEIKAMMKENEPKKKVKKFRLPFGTKVSSAKGKKGYVTVFQINENGFLNVTRELISEQTIMIDGIPRLATPEYILHLKKNPVVILPTWSVKPLKSEDLVKPFSPAEHQKESIKDGSNTKGYQILMAKMKSEAINPEKSIGNIVKWIIGLGLVAIIIYAFVSGGI